MGSKRLSAHAYKRSVGLRCLMLGLLLIQGALISLAGTHAVSATQVYKWVDERGVTHFSETPPEGNQRAQELSIEAPQPVVAPPAPATAPDQVLRRSTKPEAIRLLPSGESEFFRSSSGWFIDFDKHGQAAVLSQSLILTVKQGVPAGIFLEVEFENPETGGIDVVEAVRQGSEAKIMVISPARAGVKCRPYNIVVHVYRGRSKAFPLGVHRQVNISQVDTRDLKSAMDLLTAASRAAETGRCESAESIRHLAGRSAREMSLATYNRIREGMTEQELLDVAGPPHAVRGRSMDNKVFIYRGIGSNDFRTTVKILNGLVVDKTRSQ